MDETVKQPEMTFRLFLYDHVWQMVREELDKFLVVVVLVIVGFFLMHVMHHGGDLTIIAWLEKTFDMFSGALLTLVTRYIKTPSKVSSVAVVKENSE